MQADSLPFFAKLLLWLLIFGLGILLLRDVLFLVKGSPIAMRNSPNVQASGVSESEVKEQHKSSDLSLTVSPPIERRAQSSIGLQGNSSSLREDPLGPLPTGKLRKDEDSSRAGSLRADQTETVSTLRSEAESTIHSSLRADDDLLPTGSLR